MNSRKIMKIKTLFKFIHINDNYLLAIKTQNYPTRIERGLKIVTNKPNG